MENNPEPQKWNWEIAYKKWFFLRFFLLLVALGLCITLAYFQFVKVPHIQKANSYVPAAKDSLSSDIPFEGIYKRENSATIRLIYLNYNDYAIVGDAKWLSNSGTTNVGDIEGIITIERNQAMYSSKRDDCKLDIEFSTSSLIAEDNNECGGFNVSFTGEYKKVQ